MEHGQNVIVEREFGVNKGNVSVLADQKFSDRFCKE